ncbi:VOC family protein [Fodinicola feengrottensis]|uniref:Glyoxalase-like domain-containing protein n=1 Tax=Fodinicola feengrottensis TaxID=435914 RepID=A0ABN2HZV3_9ACTN|nr:VOC family protein [Fodinicola feengrottensis]
MRVNWVTAFLDLPRRADVRAAEAFWLDVTGTTLSARRGEFLEFATLLPAEGDACLRLQVVDGDGGCHLDLHVEDVRAEIAGAVALGAEVVDDKGTLVVFRSPGGFPFCVVAHHSESVRPEPAIWPDGQRSAVDQLCLDIPPATYQREADFWSALTGWERHPAGEFEHLVRPDRMPIRLLLQRLEEPEPFVRAHLDLACDGREPEVRRHQALGASFVRATDDWLTLLDPAGLPYCITTRVPAGGAGG